MPIPDRGERLVATLLQFKEGVTKEQAEERLKALEDIIDPPAVNEFNPDWGYPTFYIP